MNADCECGHFEGFAHVEHDESLERCVNCASACTESDESEDSDVFDEFGGGLEVFSQFHSAGSFCAGCFEEHRDEYRRCEHWGRDTDRDVSPLESCELESEDGAA